MAKKFLFMLWLCLAQIFLLIFLFFPVKKIKAEQFDNLIPLPLPVEEQVLGVAEELNLPQEAAGPHFKTGETVMINEDLVGDVYAAGATVQVNGTIVGDLLVTGGTVIINGEVTENVRAGGGKVIINGLVGKNLSVAAAKVSFGPDSLVGESVVAGGANLSLNGEVLGNMWLTGGVVELAGKFNSNVNVRSKQIDILPGVVIAGSLDTETFSHNIADDLVIEKQKNIKLIKDAKTRIKIKQKTKLVSSITQILINLISGTVLLYLFPKIAKSLSKQVLKSPLTSLGWGFAYLILTPILIILLLISIIALPIGILLLFLYLLSIMLGCWVTALAIGEKIYQQSKLEFLKSKYLKYLAGLVILAALGLLPVLGFLLKLMALILGMGAILMLIKNLPEQFQKNKKSKKL